MADARCALIVDDGDGGLGEVALRLIRLGIDVFYAKERGEGWLLAQQEAERIGALLVSPGVDCDGIDAIVDCLRSKAAGVSRTVVVIGPRADEATRVRLRASGVDWALWEPYDESALRMVVANAMTPKYEENSRKSPRLPTTLLARAFKGIRRKDGIVYTLSMDGAFLETAYPFDVGTRLTVEIELGGESLMAKADVIYSRSSNDSGKPGQPPGMGLAFRELDAASRTRLNRFLQEQEGRFAV
jgi:hypothetical protein